MGNTWKYDPQIMGSVVRVRGKKQSFLNFQGREWTPFIPTIDGASGPLGRDLTHCINHQPPNPSRAVSKPRGSVLEAPETSPNFTSFVLASDPSFFVKLFSVLPHSQDDSKLPQNYQRYRDCRDFSFWFRRYLSALFVANRFCSRCFFSMPKYLFQDEFNSTKQAFLETGNIPRLQAPV